MGVGVVIWPGRDGGQIKAARDPDPPEWGARPGCFEGPPRVRVVAAPADTLGGTGVFRGRPHWAAVSHF